VVGRGLRNRETVVADGVGEAIDLFRPFVEPCGDDIAGDRLVTDGVRAFAVILVLLGVLSFAVYRVRGRIVARLDRLI